MRRSRGLGDVYKRQLLHIGLLMKKAVILPTLLKQQSVVLPMAF
jgi:hypothetical protein